MELLSHFTGLAGQGNIMYLYLLRALAGTVFENAG